MTDTEYADLRRPTALVHQPHFGYEYGTSIIAKVLKVFLYERILRDAQERLALFHHGRWP